MRCSVSPITAVRKCPTCMAFATFAPAEIKNEFLRIGRPHSSGQRIAAHHFSARGQCRIGDVDIDKARASNFQRFNLRTLAQRCDNLRRNVAWGPTGLFRRGERPIALIIRLVRATHLPQRPRKAELGERVSKYCAQLCFQRGHRPLLLGNQTVRDLSLGTCVQPEPFSGSIELKLCFGQFEPDQNFEIGSGNGVVDSRNLDATDQVPRGIDRAIAKVCADGEHFPIENTRVATRHGNEIGVVVVSISALWPLPKREINLNLGKDRLILDIAAEQFDICDLTRIGDVGVRFPFCLGEFDDPGSVIERANGRARAGILAIVERGPDARR